MFSPFQPIPQPQSGIEAFNQGLATSQNMFNSIMQNRQVAANTATTQAKLPYVGPQAQADLTQTQLANQMYIPKTQAEIDLQRAQAGDAGAAARLKTQLLNNPALGRPGTVGDIAASAYGGNAQTGMPSGGNAYTTMPVASVSQTPSQQPVSQLAAQPQLPQAQPQSPILQQFPQLMPNASAINPQQNLMQQIQQGLSPVPNNMSAVPNNMMPNAGIPNIPAMPTSQGIPTTQAPMQNQQPIDARTLMQRDLQAQVAQEEAKANWYNQGAGRQSGLTKDEQGLQQSIAQDNPQLGNDPIKLSEAMNVVKSGGNQLSDGTPINAPSQNSLDYINKIAKDTNTTAGLKQQNADAILDGMLDKGDKLMPQASQFAGLAGKGMQTADQIAASLKADDPKYAAYLNFTRQIVPQIANQMLLTEGARVNNTQKAMMLNVANPLYWDSNPKLALQQWNYLTDTMRNLVKPIVGQGPGQIKMGLQNSSSQAPVTSSQDAGSAGNATAQTPIVWSKDSSGKWVSNK